jgi:hypothetical protein
MLKGSIPGQGMISPEYQGLTSLIGSIYSFKQGGWKNLSFYSRNSLRILNR